MLLSAASDLTLHFLLVTLLGIYRLQWVKGKAAPMIKDQNVSWKEIFNTNIFPTHTRNERIGRYAY